LCYHRGYWKSDRNIRGKASYALKFLYEWQLTYDRTLVGIEVGGDGIQPATFANYLYSLGS